VLQPSGVAVFAITALWLGGTGMIGANTLVLFFIGLPALASAPGQGSNCSASSMTERFARSSWYYC
jgi:hypothetical protein